MVNVKNLFGMAVMATALVSCSSSDDITPNANEGNQTGAAYASFKINLPTTSGTRAADDGKPSFAEGTADEYEVKNGTILIFDTDGKFVESADLGTMNPWTKDTDPNGVTTAAAATVQLHNVKVGTSYKALVLLNNNVDATTKKVALPSVGDSYYTWSATVGNANATEYVKTDGIFMANAPKYENDTENPTTLVDFNSVYASREQAQANPATVVYVERGLAKVTMDDFASNYPIAAGTYKGDNVKIVNWELDVTNKFTFPIHQADLKSEWSAVWSEPRFYDTKESSAFKRVYWGTDPNYKETNLSAETTESKTAREENFNYIKKEKLTAKPTDPLYCLENTFNVANMLQGQTTRVVFKGTYTPKSITPDENGTFYKIGKNVALWNSDDLKKHIVAAVTKVVAGASAAGTTIDVDLDATENKLTVAGNRLLDKKNISVNGIELTQPQVDAVNEKLGLSEGYGISTYEKGESYYIARIKHFGDALTPWNSGDAYNGDNLKYLGRYGMLRNNWYELNVQSVSGPGYPDVPDVKPNTPDDEIDKYIKVSVNILHWAKRSQDVNL